MSKIKEALELSIELNQHSGGWSHHRELFYAAKDELEALEKQRDTAWKELREIREAIKADENESTGDMVRFRMAELTMARHVLEDHGPEGHNVTNQQYVEMRTGVDRVKKSLKAASLDFISANGTRPEWWKSVLDLYTDEKEATHVD